MSLLIGAMTIGFILSLLALGVFISFRIFSFPDITADGSSTLGAAVAAALIVKGVNPLLATAAGFAGGFLAGAVTGILATKFKINGLLSGILVMTALYSVNLHIMGRSNVPLLGQKTLATYAERIGTKVLGGRASLNMWGWDVSSARRLGAGLDVRGHCAGRRGSLRVLPNQSGNGDARHRRQQPDDSRARGE